MPLHMQSPCLRLHPTLSSARRSERPIERDILAIGTLRNDHGGAVLGSERSLRGWWWVLVAGWGCAQWELEDRI